MAALLETLLIPRATASMAAPPPPSPISTHRAKPFNFNALKLQNGPTHLTIFSSPKLASRRTQILCQAKEAAVEVAPVSDDQWKELVLESDTPVLVEFWAPWCGPCRMIHPVIDELAKYYTGKLKCYKVNTDECPNIATTYGIRSIPTVIVFKNGEKKEAVIGAVPKTTLTTCIEKFL